MRRFILLLFLFLAACTSASQPTEPAESTSLPAEFSYESPIENLPEENGEYIAFLSGQFLGEERQLVVMNLETEEETNITIRGLVHSYSWSPDGEKLYFAWTPEVERNEYNEPTYLYVANRDGSNLEQIGEKRITYVLLAPDGETLIYQRQVEVGVSPYYLTSLSNFSNPPERELSFPHRVRSSIVFSPDSRYIAYSYMLDDADEQGIAIMRLEDGAIRVLSTDGRGDEPSSWSPDTQSILFSTGREGVSDGLFLTTDIYLLSLSDYSFDELSDEPEAEVSAVWSPNMQEILYVTVDDDGDFDLYTMSANGRTSRRLIRREGDEQFPQWQPVPAD